MRSVQKKHCALYRLYRGRVGYGPSLLGAEFVGAEFVRGRVLKRRLQKLVPVYTCQIAILWKSHALAQIIIKGIDKGVASDKRCNIYSPTLDTSIQCVLYKKNHCALYRLYRGRVGKGPSLLGAEFVGAEFVRG